MKVIFLDIDGVLNTKIKGVIDEDKLINLRNTSLAIVWEIE